jgi:hypothetical protein
VGTHIGNAADSYSGVARFESRPDTGYLEDFRGFTHYLLENSGRARVPTVGHDRFLRNHFEFLIHQSFYHSTLYIYKVTGGRDAAVFENMPINVDNLYISRKQKYLLVDQSFCYKHKIYWT